VRSVSSRVSNHGASRKPQRFAQAEKTASEIPLVAQDHRAPREFRRVAVETADAMRGRLQRPVVTRDGPAPLCAQPLYPSRPGCNRGSADTGQFMKSVLMRAKCGHAGYSSVRRNRRNGSDARCRQDHRKSRWPAAPCHRRGIKAGPGRGMGAGAGLRSAPCSLRCRTIGCRRPGPLPSPLCGKP
jgi:hypothetical protein